MRSLAFVCAVLCLVSLFGGCETTRRLWAWINDLSVGAYRATPQQRQLADQRPTAAFRQFSTPQRKALEESGTTLLAVRTADPTPAQWHEIRKEMQKPASRYFGASRMPEKVYCIMIWDTQSGEVVGSDCYAVLKLPVAGELVRFDTYAAQFVGGL